MKPLVMSALLLGCVLPLAAQTVAPQPETSDLGFTYNLPAAWDVLNMAPAMPAVKLNGEQSATSAEEKKGVDCTQVFLTARHGDPASVIVVVALPFDCFGQTLTSSDLPAFGEGAAQGMEQNFTLRSPVFGAYMLGSHSVWIERAQGSPTGHPENQYTLEIACTVVKKAAVCWLGMVTNPAELATFENSTVSLEGEPAAQLVPATAFQSASPQ